MEKEFKPSLKESLEGLKDARIDDFYDYAMDKNPGLKDIPEQEMKSNIRKIINEIDLLEKVGENDLKRLESLEKDGSSDKNFKEILKNIGLIWEISGSGTFDKPFGEDPYKNYPWTRNMDRNRLNYTMRLAKKITEINSGKSFKGMSSVTKKVKTIKEAILRYGPYILYNGAPIQNEAVERALDRKGVVVPKEKVEIIDEEIKNTRDQIKTFRLPEGFELKGKEIALVAHAPQLVRIMRMINHYKPFPENTMIRLFPLPTSPDGKQTYAKMEVSGSLYYTYISHDADAESYPYKINK